MIGGVFGRMDAAYVTIEAQKSTGSLHAHCQCFVQCLHQHTALEEIFALGAEKLKELREAYVAYSGHVMHGVYAGLSEQEIVTGIAAAEASWPEHKLEERMVACPAYQRRRASQSDCAAEKEAEAWAMEYLAEDVAALQFLKQHHYHPPNAETGERVPLHGCQKADKPGACKSDFPRQAWLTDKGEVLCPCKAEAFGMSTQGRKNRIGALHGPYGNEWLNCCHPALLAGLRGVNVDVQLPYRLPFDCGQCGNAISKQQWREIIRAVQRAQDAQTGYCADYCAKNQPMAFHEIKEFQKGHQHLHSKYKHEPIDKLGKRHVTRFLSDAYCKGIVRGQVECCNLRAQSRPGNVVAAERISTAAFCAFPGRNFLQTVNTAFGEMEEWAVGKKYIWTRKGLAGQRQMREMDPAQVYGHRPKHDDVWFLSPYEFTMYWDCVPMKMPQTRMEWTQQPRGNWDVTLTRAGEAKLAVAKSDNATVRLVPGVDVLRSIAQNTTNKIYFDSSAGRALQHGWYLCRRLRPLCPQFATSPVPSKWGDDPERNAKLTLAFFRAWTSHKGRGGNTAVPYVRHLRQEGETWAETLRAWLLQLPCEETKRYVGNFLSVYRVRPEMEAENSNDEDDHEDLVVAAEKLAQACETHGAQSEGDDQKGKWAVHRSLIVEAMHTANGIWKPSIAGVCASQNPCESLDSAAIVKSARRKPQQKSLQGDVSVWEPEFAARIVSVTDAKRRIQAWEESVGDRRCNAKQAEVCRKVALQVREELAAEGTASVEPLRWAVHGGPGTGKSHVLNLIRKELFEETLGWKQGDEFQVVTLQAVMANDLDGDTIHHALGLNWQGVSDERISGHKLLELSQKALRWRWAHHR